MEVSAEMLTRIIGEQEIEKRVLRDNLRRLVAENQRLTSENAAMAAQIGADHGEPS